MFEWTVRSVSLRKEPSIGAFRCSSRSSLETPLDRRGRNSSGRRKLETPLKKANESASDLTQRANAVTILSSHQERREGSGPMKRPATRHCCKAMTKVLLPAGRNDAMRNCQIARILTLISVLDRSPHGLSVSEMKKALENRGIRVTARTLYRDIDALDQAGLPLFPADESDDQPNARRWRFNHTLKVVKALSDSPRLAS